MVLTCAVVPTARAFAWRHSRTGKATSPSVWSPQQGLTLARIEGRLYDGTVSGKLNIGWAKAWAIAGSLAIQGVEIQPIVALYTKDTTISGRLTANPVVDMRAPTAAQLGDALDVESDFKVEKGILYNIDLSNAPKALLNKDALRGGQTQFDNFSGHVSVDSAGYYLSKVEIASGVLTADAEVSISSKQELSGQIDVAIKGTSALVSTPLALSGTVQNPSLYPSKVALAGAAAGTALLGPGLGTAVLEPRRFIFKVQTNHQSKQGDRKWLIQTISRLSAHVGCAVIAFPLRSKRRTARLYSAVTCPSTTAQKPKANANRFPIEFPTSGASRVGQAAGFRGCSAALIFDRSSRRLSGWLTLVVRHDTMRQWIPFTLKRPSWEALLAGYIRTR